MAKDTPLVISVAIIIVLCVLATLMFTIGKTWEVHALGGASVFVALASTVYLIIDSIRYTKRLPPIEVAGTKVRLNARQRLEVDLGISYYITGITFTGIVDSKASKLIYGFKIEFNNDKSLGALHVLVSDLQIDKIKKAVGSKDLDKLVDILFVNVHRHTVIHGLPEGIQNVKYLNSQGLELMCKHWEVSKYINFSTNKLETIHTFMERS